MKVLKRQAFSASEARQVPARFTVARSRERLALLCTIRRRRPDSLYELARIVGRDFKNVQDDIGILERHGRVRFIKAPHGKQRVKVMQVPFEEIALRMAI